MGEVLRHAPELREEGGQEVPHLVDWEELERVKEEVELHAQEPMRMQQAAEEGEGELLR